MRCLFTTYFTCWGKWWLLVQGLFTCTVEYFIEIVAVFPSCIFFLSASTHLLWLTGWIRDDVMWCRIGGMWHWDYTPLSQTAVFTMLLLCFRAVRRFSGWYPWTKTITLSAITVRWGGHCFYYVWLKHWLCTRCLRITLSVGWNIQPNDFSHSV